MTSGKYFYYRVIQHTDSIHIKLNHAVHPSWALQDTLSNWLYMLLLTLFHEIVEKNIIREWTKKINHQLLLWSQGHYSSLVFFNTIILLVHANIARDKQTSWTKQGIYTLYTNRNYNYVNQSHLVDYAVMAPSGQIFHYYPKTCMCSSCHTYGHYSWRSICHDVLTQYLDTFNTWGFGITSGIIPW